MTNEKDDVLRRDTNKHDESTGSFGTFRYTMNNYI